MGVKVSLLEEAYLSSTEGNNNPRSAATKFTMSLHRDEEYAFRTGRWSTTNNADLKVVKNKPKESVLCMEPLNRTWAYQSYTALQYQTPPLSVVEGRRSAVLKVAIKFPRLLKVYAFRTGR